MDLLLATPRGFCAGVDRAVQTVERALTQFGTPLYVRHEIIHNKTVVADFEAKGVIFTENLNSIPPGSTVVFSAHGVSQAVTDEAKKIGLKAIDATCPLVTKVHNEIKRFYKQGYHILLVGHVGHVEIEGTAGQVPASATTLIETLDDAKCVIPPQPEKLALLTQTTLSIDETRAIIELLKQRFPTIVLPAKGDICYATQNRQDAVKEIAPQVDVFLVVGSQNSSNSNRLKETALTYGAKRAYLIDGPEDITSDMLKNAAKLGLTSGASGPEEKVQAVIAMLKPNNVIDVTTVQEDMHFSLPKEVRIVAMDEAS